MHFCLTVTGISSLVRIPPRAALTVRLGCFLRGPDWIAASKVMLGGIKKIVVIELPSGSVPNKTTSLQLQVYDETVRAVVQRFKLLGTDEDHPRSGRPTSQVILKAHEVVRGRTVTMRSDS